MANPLIAFPVVSRVQAPLNQRMLTVVLYHIQLVELADDIKIVPSHLDHLARLLLEPSPTPRIHHIVHLLVVAE